MAKAKKNTAKKLGKVGKPPAEKFIEGRKLFFVPLIFAPIKPEPDLMKLINKYWKQAREQVKNLEDKLTGVKKVYHELITSAGDEGIKAIEQLNAGSYPIVKNSLDKGAELQPIEDGELLIEFMDWSRFLAIGPQSKKTFTQVYESYLEVQKKRNEQIASRIDETLKDNEIGLLLMREGHQIQFPSDIQVFYIAPPSLDEIQRWSQKSETKDEKEEKRESKS